MKRQSAGQAGGGLRLKPGTHAALLYENARELEPALAFLAEGVANEERCICLAYSRFNERVQAQLRDLHGTDVRRAEQQERLAFLSGDENAKALRADLLRRLAHATVKSPMRLLTCLGWGEAGWPDEHELIQLEAQMNELCADRAVATLCLYDTRQLSGSLVLHGGLECHPVLLARGAAHKNPLYVEPQAILREVGVRRREESRLRSWM